MNVEIPAPLDTLTTVEGTWEMLNGAKLYFAYHTTNSMYRKKTVQLVGQFYKDHHDNQNNYVSALFIITLLKLSNASAKRCFSFQT